MGRFGFLSLALLSLQAVLARGQEDAPAEGKHEQSEAPQLKITASASFPASEIFGVKLVNGHPTQALVSVANDEPNPITVNFIGGGLWTPSEEGLPSQNVRNLTATRYAVEIPTGEKQELSYAFATEMHPQDLRLQLAAVISDVNGQFFTVHAYNGTVSIVEPDTSIFDPQIIFLYVFLLTCSAGIGYFFYNLWIAPYFPQKRGRSGAKKASEKPKSEASEQVSGDGSDATSGKAFNTEWIPAHHINRPEARKVKGKSKSRA